ncbi:nucleotidyltransferase [Clostridia bacterium]|nr:nucleotidyltransferase [Clostridia bacterium]
MVRTLGGICIAPVKAKKPVLVVMAAGLGSRYGGLKQIAPVDEAGHMIMDFSVYDAREAGFETVVFIVRPELEKEFREKIGGRMEPFMETRYACQLMTALPPGFAVPEGRVKPWGTAHAILSAKDQIGAAFAVINADDYYGANAFKAIYDFLSRKADDLHHAMVGYKIENTLTENGHVARGICSIDPDGRLTGITERTYVEPRPGGAAYREEGGGFTFLPSGTMVSMNLWGFGISALSEIEERFPAFLAAGLEQDPLTCEYLLPSIPNALIAEHKAEVRVLAAADKWYGVTYARDMPKVREAIARMKAEGKYPGHLWRNK